MIATLYYLLFKHHFILNVIIITTDKYCYDVHYFESHWPVAILYLNRKLGRGSEVNKKYLNYLFHTPIGVTMVLHSKNGEKIPKVQHHQNQSNNGCHFLDAQFFKQRKPLVHKNHAQCHYAI